MNLLLNLGDTLIKKLGDFKISEYWIDGRLTQMAKADVSGGNIIGAVVISVVVIGLMGVLVFLINRKRDA